MKFLGNILSSDLKWNKHVDIVVTLNLVQLQPSESSLQPLVSTLWAFAGVSLYLAGVVGMF